jgi:hypothetical protein
MWIYTIDFKEITQWVEQGGSKKLQKASHWTVILKRKLFKMTAYVTKVGNSYTGFEGITHDDFSLKWSANPLKKFLCVGEHLELQDPHTGEYDVTLTLVHIGDFKDVPAGTFS